MAEDWRVVMMWAVTFAVADKDVVWYLESISEGKMAGAIPAQLLLLRWAVELGTTICSRQCHVELVVFIV